MTWWHRVWRRRTMEAQLDKELRFHVDQHEAELIAQGCAPEDARRRARLALGGPEQVKEECRDARGTRWLDDTLQDARHASPIAAPGNGRGGDLDAARGAPGRAEEAAADRTDDHHRVARGRALGFLTRRGYEYEVAYEAIRRNAA